MRLSVLLAPLVIASVAAPALAQAAGGQPFRVFFDWGKPELTKDAQAILDEAVAAYGRPGAGQVEVAGHSDRSGPASVNIAASRRRAEAVKAYLVEHGIQAASISVRAFGESRPIVATEDGVREMQNRRVEVSFAGEAASAADLGANSAMIIRADGSRGKRVLQRSSVVAPPLV